MKPENKSCFISLLAVLLQEVKSGNGIQLPPPQVPREAYSGVPASLKY